MTRDEFAAGDYGSQALHDDTIALRTWTNAAWGAGAVLAITGVVLLVTSGRSAKPRNVAVW